MDLNSIILPASVVAELYDDTIVDTGELQAKSPPIASPVTDPGVNGRWKWLGENHKNILVLVRYPEAEHLPGRPLHFLTGMLTACKLELKDVAVLNLAQDPGAEYKELIKEFRSRVVLLFDVEPSLLGLPINFPHFQIQPFANNSFLYSPSLEMLEEDKILKSKLWVCLRRLFNI